MPFTILPMVIVEVQDVVASGQVRPSDKLLDAYDQRGVGNVSSYLGPIYPGPADCIPPGSHCTANAYTDNYGRLENDATLGFDHRIFLHVVDTVAPNPTGCAQARLDQANSNGQCTSVRRRRALLEIRECFG